MAETCDDGAEHRHQLLLLLGEVLRERRAHLRRDLEQASVKQVGGRGGDWNDLGKARLHELDLVGRHGAFSPRAVSYPLGTTPGLSRGDVVSVAFCIACVAASVVGTKPFRTPE